MEVFVREATEGDYERICELFAQGDALHYEALPAVFRRAEGPARDRDFISQMILDEDAALLVAQEQSEIVGVLRALVRKSLDHPSLVPRSYVEIAELVVENGFWGQGVGRLLMEAAHEWTFRKGLMRIELNVWEFNQDAVAFYEKLGYSTASRRLHKSLE